MPCGGGIACQLHPRRRGSGQSGGKIKKGSCANSFLFSLNGNLIKQSNGLEFFYDHTGVFAVKYADSTYFYRKDAQANIVALLDNTGAVIVKYNYSNGTFPTAPTKLAKSGFVEKGLKKAFNYIEKHGWSL
jgi:hypothetical protein